MKFEIAKQRPICFSDSEVRAVLEGRKLQTARIVNPQPYKENTWGRFDSTNGLFMFGGGPQGSTRRSNFGEPGDRLWVRENWREDPLAYRADTPDWDTNVEWMPAMRMPRVFSRILIEVKRTRVGRAQELNLEDLKAQGCTAEEFRESWMSSYGTGRGGRDSWESNPWIWLIDFVRCE